MSNAMSQSDIFVFPQGIPGFEDIHEFRIEYDKEQPLAQLISVNDKNIGFVLIRPEVSFPNYLQEIQFGQESLSVLEIDDISMLEIWVILTLNQKDIENTTANLCAPLILNPRVKLGAQFILTGDKFTSREPIFKKQTVEAQEEGAAG